MQDPYWFDRIERSPGELDALERRRRSFRRRQIPILVVPSARAPGQPTQCAGIFTLPEGWNTG